MHLQNFTQRNFPSINHHVRMLPCLPAHTPSRMPYIPSLTVRTSLFFFFPFLSRLRISPRPISIRQLNALLHLHPGPIHLVVFKGSYFFQMAYLILRGASRLDAFSVYPFRTWLPCRAFGNTTGTPAVRPSRSSRTKDSSSQISSARAG